VCVWSVEGTYSRSVRLCSISGNERGRGAGLGVDDVVDGGEQLVHALAIGEVWVLAGVDEQDAVEVCTGGVCLEELVLGVGPLQVAVDLLLQLLVGKVSLPGAVCVL